ncbi:MAG: LamG domain-containing protein [Sedimentisphaerales bacterium]|nr:LamG domain-containing protein [Sedimentisphaerales bacterium]
MKLQWVIISFLLIWALTLSTTVNARIIGQWTFDGDLKDSVGSNDGTAHGDAFVGTDNGNFGGAAEFDGAGDFIVIPTPSLSGTTWSLTWWSFAPAGSSNTGYMVASGDPSGFEAFFFRRYGPEAYAGGITQDTNVTPRISLGEPSPYPQGQWHHHAVLHDGSTSTAYWYIDGSLWVDTNAADTNKTTFTSFDEVIYVGNRKSGGRDFEGKIDDLRLYDNVLPTAQIDAIMNGSGSGYPYASSPDPSDGSLHEDTWVNLSWRPGDSAVSHDVYLGDNFDDVSNGTEDTFRGNQNTTFYVAGFAGFAYPDGLVPGTTYYWRIDEVNDADPNSPWKGPIWSFSIPPKTAYAPDPADGAEFVDLDAELSWTAGYGAILHTVYLGDDYDDVSNAESGPTQGKTTYKPDSLESEKVYYWRIDENDGIDTYKGDIWSFTTPGAAGNPFPANGATGVQQTQILSWTPADTASSHQVYFGTDKDAVKNATTASPEYKGSRALGSENYDPDQLDWLTSYYWRVDAVYDANPVKGLVWSFTTANFLLVDDFEGYTDDDAAGEAIWQSWIDGYGIAGNGAQVGYLLPPYCEQTIVHGGLQSMPLLYTNEADTTNSEVTRTLTSPRDWTVEGVEELSLWFRGRSANAAEPLYMGIANSAGALAVVAYEDANAAQKGTWTQWTISLQAFTDQGINLTNVDTIAVGLGTKASLSAPGGSGTIYIDDIRLYRSGEAISQ